MDGDPFHPTRVRPLMRTILTSGTVRFSGHALAEMAKDNLTTVDCTHVRRWGVVEPPAEPVLVPDDTEDGA